MSQKEFNASLLATKEAASSLPYARRQRIVELVQSRKMMTTLDLISELGASAATVRRDLGVLEEQNLVKRTHGGVVKIDAQEAVLSAYEADRAEYEPAFREKIMQARTAKKRIADAAATMVEDGATLILDSGTTSLALAQKLAGRRITVVALDLKVAEATAHGATEVLIIGGRIRPGVFSVVGPWVDSKLESMAVDTFFMGADAINEAGLTNSAIEEARVKMLAMKSAKKTIVIADHSKFNLRKMAPVCQIEQIDVLLTDKASKELIEPYSERFPRVVYV